MSNQKNGLTEEEFQMMEEMEQLIAEMKQHPEYANAEVPESLRKELFRDIREYEAERAKEVPKQAEPEVTRLTEEEMEWIRLGKRYKKSKKNKKFYVLIAAAVLAMGLGITSMGGPERVMERVNWRLAGREQTNIDSGNNGIVQMENVVEEELYQQIENEYGFIPVRMWYLPKGIEFMQGDLHDGMQSIQIHYGNGNKVNITYMIRPNYRGSSLGIDVEDEIIEEYVEKVGETNIYVKQYRVSEVGEERWTAEFNYGDTQYYMMFLDVKGVEVEKIIENLYFF